MKLIKELCEVHSPSGDEYQMKDFILKYINKEKNKWLKVPKIIQGDEMQDCLMLVFGKPRTAIFAHMDSIGFTAKYNNEIIKIGSPVVEEGTPTKIIKALKRRGHQLKIQKSMGRVNLIFCETGLPAKEPSCGFRSDPRGFGLASVPTS